MPARRKLPMTAEELLEAGVLVYLRGLGLRTGGRTVRAAAAAGRLDRARARSSYVNVIYIHTDEASMSIAERITTSHELADAVTAKLDEFGNPAWIALMSSGSSSGGRWASRSSPSRSGADAWDAAWRSTAGSARWSACRQDGPDARHAWRAAAAAGAPPPAAIAPSTNTAPRRCARLEEEQREFRDFLDRLRFAKDKAEFDQFMAERRNRPAPGSAAPGRKH